MWSVQGRFGLLPLVLLCCSYPAAQAANILGLVSTPHHNNPAWTQPLFAALAERGHTLTVLSTAPVQHHPAIKHIPLSSHYDVAGKHYRNVGTGQYNSFWSVRHLQIWYEAMLGSCRELLESDVLEQHEELLLQHYDLIIYDATYATDCLLHLLLKRRQCPVLGLSGGKLSTDLLTVMRAMDTVGASSVPHFVSELPQQMSYWQRVWNHAIYLTENFVRVAVVKPVLSGVLQAENLYPRVHFMLLNTHPVLDYVQNMPPNIVEVGGLHMQPESSPLPKRIEQFNEQHEQGIIYISLPYMDLVSDTGLAAIMNVLHDYGNYGVLWNVQNVVRKELPAKQMGNLQVVSVNGTEQQDILAQCNVLAFITHGDSFSLQEAIYHAVPVIVLPLFLEQINNGQRVQERLLGLTIPADSFTPTSFSLALQRLLHDSSYAKVLESAQQSFRTSMVPPVQQAVWYAEQLLSQPYLFDHLAVPDAPVQNYFVRHSIDVLLLPALFLLLFIFNVAFLIMQAIERSKQKPEQGPPPVPRLRAKAVLAKQGQQRNQEKHDKRLAKAQKTE